MKHMTTNKALSWWKE